MYKINLISSKYNHNKSKLYFSRHELIKILEYYSNGVSKGNWKDYSIDFSENTAYFHIYKNFSEKPTFSILKRKAKKNTRHNFQLHKGIYKYLSNTSLENLFIYLNRNNIKLIKK